MDVFSKLDFEKLTESVLGKNVEVAAKHSVMEVFIMSVEQAKRTSTYRTMTLAGRICPFPLWLRTWFS